MPHGVSRMLPRTAGAVRGSRCCPPLRKRLLSGSGGSSGVIGGVGRSGACGSVRCHSTRWGRKRLVPSPRSLSAAASLPDSTVSMPSSFSSRPQTTTPTPDPNPDPTPLSAVTSMEGLWKTSTAVFLDQERTPVGSLDSLQWHLAETLVLHWSRPPAAANTGKTGGGHRGIRGIEAIPLEAAVGGHETALKILDRLAEEKRAVASSHHNNNSTSADNRNDEDDDEDFRTIDVSLVHAFLKQWKECLHQSSKERGPKRHRARYTSRNSDQRNHQRQNERSPKQRQEQPQAQEHQQQQQGPLDGILLPSQLLQKLDYWTGAADSSRCDSIKPDPNALLEPNIATYTLLMDGAASCSSRYQESAGFCEALLERLFRESDGESGAGARDSLRPTMVTIGIFLRVLANHKTVASAELAESWLRRIPGLLAAGDGGEPARPSAVAYTTVVRAWAGLGRADRAEALLREMCEAYFRGGAGSGAAEPNLWTFNTVLAAWSRSRDPGAVQKAESLVRTMESLSSGAPAIALDVAPTIVSYNSLLSTIASRSSRPDSLARAESWMEEILRRAADPSRHGRGPQRTGQATPDRGDARHEGTPRAGDSSLAPNLVTYRALFNIVAGAGHLAPSEQADRMRYWLARGAEASSCAPDGRPAKGPPPSLRDHPLLLGQIRAAEERRGQQRQPRHKPPARFGKE